MNIIIYKKQTQKNEEERLNKYMTNVVQFPRANRRIPIQSLEEMQADVKNNKIKFINGVVDHYCSQLINKFSANGLNVQTEEFLRDFAFGLEAMRSGLYRSVDIKQPLQDVLDSTIEKLESEGVLELDSEIYEIDEENEDTGEDDKLE